MCFLNMFVGNAGAEWLIKMMGQPQEETKKEAYTKTTIKAHGQ